MRRGFALLVGVTVLGVLTPAAFGQYSYPYPYGPMPAPYPPPYGYPMPMPAYVPNPISAQPMYYPMPAMMPAVPERNTKVFVYGPLTDETVSMPPASLKVLPPPSAIAGPPKKDAAPTEVSQAQAVLMRGGALPTYSKADLPPDACGPNCGPSCGGAQPYEPPMRGHGHFIGETGAYFLVPIFSPHAAFTTTNAAGATTTQFPNQVDFGERASLGYVFHSGWGFRADYEHLQGSMSSSTGNADPGTTITTPLPIFPLMSPSAALLGGIGVDQYRFRQRLELNLADVEAIKECSVLDTTLLFSFGARYMRFVQGYNATRVNAGGNNGAVTVALDREDVEAVNRFEGWGPTVSLEAIHPLKCGFALYGDVRGSFLWGTDNFTQDYRNQNRTVNAAGVPTFTDNMQAIANLQHRFAPMFETEAGVQYGCRLGRCYLFARMGVAYQRWWDVGNPTASNGNMTFLGGTVRTGITY